MEADQMIMTRTTRMEARVMPMARSARMEADQMIMTRTTRMEARVMPMARSARMEVRRLSVEAHAHGPERPDGSPPVSANAVPAVDSDSAVTATSPTTMCRRRRAHGWVS